MNRFAALLDRLAYTPQRNAKLRLLDKAIALDDWIDEF